jgi:hypothetical protein
MKKSIIVRTEKHYEIDIVDSALTQEFINEFEKYMWQLEGYTLEEKRNDLFAHAARQLAQGEEYFIEGIGKTASLRTLPFKQKQGEKIDVVWVDTYEDVETEVAG